MITADAPLGGLSATPAHQQTLSLAPLTPRTLLSRILLATDGSGEADGAVALSLALARQRDAIVEVLSVLTPTGYSGPPGRRARIDDERRAQRRHVVAQQLATASTLAQRWPVDLEIGTPHSIIASEACARFVDLVVMGLSRHTLIDRVFRDETTLRVMRRIKMPLLAVAASLRHLPQRVVVAVDFSRSSIHAARAASRLVAENGELYIVHVEPRAEGIEESADARQLVNAHGVDAAFDHLLSSLDLPKGVSVIRSVVEGPPFAEIEAVLSRTGAQLLALGTTRHDLIERVAIGRMTSAFTREASVSLLVAPADARQLDDR